MAPESKKSQPPGVPIRTFLAAKPFRNERMEMTRRKDGTILAAIPMRRPRWLVPPLSWILPYSSHRRVELDPLGAAVFELCDGKHSVESIVENFAAMHKLSFREAQLSVTQFLRQLAQRGLVALVALEKDAERP